MLTKKSFTRITSSRSHTVYNLVKIKKMVRNFDWKLKKLNSEQKKNRKNYTVYSGLTTLI